MTYNEYRTKREKEANELPLMFAFGTEQFKRVCEEHGIPLDGSVKLVSLGAGAFCKKDDYPVIERFTHQEKELKCLMSNYDFAYEAFYYEMGNHEYHINYQGDWDVCSCFGECEWSEDKTGLDYLVEMGYGNETARAYVNARKKFLKECRDRGEF